MERVHGTFVLFKRRVLKTLVYGQVVLDNCSRGEQWILFPETKSRKTLRFEGNKIHYSPRDQSLSDLLRMGYWPSVKSIWLDIGQVLFCVFMDRDEVEVHKLAKKERGQYPAILTEQTWSIKDLLYGFWWNFACGIQRVVPSGQDGSILPARVANHSARFGSSCPLAELAI